VITIIAVHWITLAVLRAQCKLL